jgi:uncharacterized protein affecting Mg2+/Co2+ transport
LHRVYLPTSVAVPPGATHTFTFNVTAPVTTGAYEFQWRMLQEGQGKFGDRTPNITISVPPVVRTAQFVSQQVPTTMVAGQQYQVSVTMRNTGNVTWTYEGRYKLGSQNPNDNMTWGRNRVLLSAATPVPPGATHTFTFNVTAPAASGVYQFQWRMLQEGNGKFGDFTANQSVTVEPSPPHEQPPTTLSGRH